ncbi:MAG TPA: MFS transporter [Candidatus Microsaccharimonas sp.]
MAFLFYVGGEVAIGLWLASYLVTIQMFSIQNASLFAGLFYASITVGRIVTGFISIKVESRMLIRYGIALAVFGLLLLMMNFGAVASFLGILLIGLGFAPIYPGMIHLTPERFGKSKSAKVMSLQMVAGYIGASSIPPLIGALTGLISLNSFVLIVVVALIGLALSTELVGKKS